MSVVAVMFIKLSNERCPNKNIRLLGNKPLLQHELLTFQSINITDDIYVYCSDESVKQYLPKGIKFLQRPSYLDSPSTNFTQIFDSFINEVNADTYVLLHATAPFISSETMRECVNAVLSGQYDSSFCATKIQTFLWKDKQPYNFDASNLPRTQDLEPIYAETSGIYVFKKSVFKKYHRRVGFNPFIKCVDIKESIDIDYPEDFKLAQKYLR